MGLYIVLKTTVPAETLSGPVRDVAHRLDPDAALRSLQPLDVYVDRELSGTSAMTWLFGAFAAVAAFLAALGIFGVISYTVARRSREIGLRIALGASPTDVVRWISGQGVRLSLAGVVIGLVGATVLTRTLSHFLYEVSRTEPVVYAGFAIALVAVAATASYLPARRATRVDPITVLTAE